MSLVLIISWVLGLVLLYRVTYTYLLSTGMPVSSWLAFWGSTVLCLIISGLWPIWLPFVLVHKGGKLLLGGIGVEGAVKRVALGNHSSKRHKDAWGDISITYEKVIQPKELNR